VLDREPAAGHVVDGDRGEARVVGLPIDEHRGRPAVAESGEAVEVVAERGDEDTGDALLLEEVEVGALAVEALVAVAEQDRQSFGVGAVLGTAGDVGEERVADVEHDEADAAAPTGAELSGRVVPHETELVDGRVHAFDGDGRHLLGAVQDVGDGSDRDAGPRRDVLHARTHGSPSPVGPAR
jgi:hypothetical protein